jgi:hypothetical protein
MAFIRQTFGVFSPNIRRFFAKHSAFFAVVIRVTGLGEF